MSKLPLSQLIDALQTELTKLRNMRSVAGVPTDLVADALAKYPGTARADLVVATRLQPKAVSRALEELQAAGKAIHFGERRGSRWFLVETLDNLTKP